MILFKFIVQVLQLWKEWYPVYRKLDYTFSCEWKVSYIITAVRRKVSWQEVKLYQKLCSSGGRYPYGMSNPASLWETALTAELCSTLLREVSVAALLHLPKGVS